MSDDKRQSYLETFQRSIRGEAISFDAFLEHFDAQNADPPAGIGVGDKVDGLLLADQAGNLRSISDLSGPNGLLVVFVRSANWCGYCRNQLAELNLAVDDARRRGLNLAAIAPDHPDIIRKFAQSADLKYPVLADPKAVAIDIFDVGNDNVPVEAVKRLGREMKGIVGRVPFPAHFLLAPDGTVLAKSVCDDLRHRPSGTTLLFKHFGPGDGGVGAKMESDQLLAEIVLATGSAMGGQQIAFSVTLTPASGVHIYAPGAAEGYTGLDVTFDDKLVAERTIEFPTPKLLRLDAVGEELAVFDDAVRGKGVIKLNWSPPIHGSRQLRGISERLAEMATPPGVYELNGCLRYQACTDTYCFAPSSIKFSLPFEILPDTDKVAPVFDGELS